MESKQDQLKTINIYSSHSENIFTCNDVYEIPLYQRAFAWTYEQLSQLIEDIVDFSGEGKYYLGTLIVAQKAGIEHAFEVIDGQQRLTALLLLFGYLGIATGKGKPSLRFACRTKAEYTLSHLVSIISEIKGNIQNEKILSESAFEKNVDAALYEGLKNIHNIITQQKNKGILFENLLLEKLKKVVLFRIPVPNHTDLNRYFETMNTRGEQLEPQYIVKADLMSGLKSERDRNIFAAIWDACSDMTGYVQMHFDNKIRSNLFGPHWNNLSVSQWDRCVNAFCDFEKTRNNGLEEATQEGHGCNYSKSDIAPTIQDILSSDFVIESVDEYLNAEDAVRVRFEGIVDFPHFLLHVLQVFEHQNRRENGQGKRENNEPLDDLKLVERFKTAKELYGNEEGFAKKIALLLLKARFLFDTYIIKREFKNADKIGEWSLKSINTSGCGSKKKAYYEDTVFSDSGKHSSTKAKDNKINLMIQSALRVSYTSPKAMHWITELLIWLVEDGCKIGKLTKFCEKAETIAKRSVKQDFLDGERFDEGVQTPHIVFHYLDYLLWKENPQKYKDFTFEFRNSVEHWYPQNPSEGTFEKWCDVNRFGNLCILQATINSRFSNRSLIDKRDTYKSTIDKGSLKLRNMRDKTDEGGSAENWKNEKCKEHELEMIALLRKACATKSE